MKVKTNISSAVSRFAAPQASARWRLFGRSPTPMRVLNPRALASAAKRPAAMMPAKFSRPSNPFKPLLPNRFMGYLDATIVLLCGFVLIRTAAELLHSVSGERDEAGRQAAREYDRGVQDFGASGQIETKAEEAKQAVEGPEAETMKQAESAGKDRSKGDEPGGKR